MAEGKHTGDSFFPQDRKVFIRRYKFQNETFYVAIFEGSTAPQYTIVPPEHFADDTYWYKAGVLSRLLYDGHEFFDAFKWLDKTSKDVDPIEVKQHAPLSFISRVFLHWDTMNELTNLYTDKPTPAMIALVKACKERFYSAALKKRIQEVNERISSHMPHYKKAGWVYLIRSFSGHYKIGLSTNPAYRVETFGVKLPFEVYPVCLIRTNNALELERELHDRFSSSRQNGSEFFDLTWDEVKYIKGLAL